MVLLIDNGGQTCNQLWAYASAFIHSVETEERICVLAYDKEIVHFPSLRNSEHFWFPLYSDFFHKFLGIDTYIKIIRKILNGKHHDLYPIISRLLGWKIFKPWDDLYSMSPQNGNAEISSLFKPSKSIVDDVELQYSSRTSGYDLVIGVHIRRGDYRLWQCGHYFFDMKEYIEICFRISKLYPEKKIKFFVSTNECVDPSDWEGLDYFLLKNTTAMKDLYCLSKCDYIIGPPSSFSRWAAFIGCKKLCFILNKNQQEFQFKRVSSYGYFDDGSPIWYNLYSDDAPSCGIPNHPMLKKERNEDK